MKENYTKNSLFAMNALLSTIKGFKKVFGFNRAVLVFLLFFVQAAVAQTVGDYRSKASGAWKTAGSWEICTSVSPSTWVTATNYPGEIAGTGAVLIQTNHIITISSVITPQSMGTLTIDGVLKLNGGTAAAIDFNINTQNIIITSSGYIFFDNKVNLILPATATLQVVPSTTSTNTSGPLQGDCSAQQSIYMGTIQFSVCQANGGDTGFTFKQLVLNGGTLNAIITANALSLCEGETISLTRSMTGPVGTELKYSWSITDPAGTKTLTNSTLVVNGQDPSLNINSAKAGTYEITLTYSTKYSSGVYTNSEKATVIVKARPTEPSTFITQYPDCTIATGSVSLSGLPTGGPSDTWDLYQNGITLPIKTNGVGPVFVVTGLAVSNAAYTFTVSYKGCTSPSSDVVFINTPNIPLNTWKGGVWSTGSIPNANEAIVFEQDYPPALDPNIDIIGCSCKVLANKKVLIKSGHTLKITNKVEVEETGTLTFENNASLVQKNDAAVNKGNIIYKRKTPSVRSSDYTYWSSPVASQNFLKAFPSIGSGRLYFFNALSTPANWNGVVSPTMAIGTGYIVQVPLATSPTTYETTFEGLPNNGVITTTTGPTGSFNLIGNPYPSAISADAFITAETNRDIINGTLYFWTHNTPIAMNTPNPGSGVYAYTQNDYASYNVLGGVATAALSGVLKPSGYIAAGQSFFVSSKIKGAITFKNAMRLAVKDGKDVILDNSQFFKGNTTTKAVQTIEKNRIWLNLTNSQGAFKQILVGYSTGATNGYDSSYDGQSFNANAYINFYSINLNRNWSIQGRALPFVSSDLIPLGYSSNIVGDFAINIDQLDGVFTNNPVFLEDKLTNTIFDLKSGDYKFTTAVGVFNDRFVLRYTNKTLGAEDFSILENQVLVSNANRQIQISSSIDNLAKVVVYDITGKQLYAKTKLDVKELQISNLGISHQVLVVKISLENGQEITKKIIF